MTTRTPEEIRAVIFDVLGAIAPEIDSASLNPDKPLRDQVDLDSFDFLNIIIRLHEILGVDIPETDYAELLTLNGAVKYLAARSVAQASAKP